MEAFYLDEPSENTWFPADYWRQICLGKYIDADVTYHPMQDGYVDNGITLKRDDWQQIPKDATHIQLA
jgi:hypothetical protein